MQANFTILPKKNHMNTAQNLLNLAPRGSKQGTL